MISTILRWGGLISIFAAWGFVWWLIWMLEVKDSELSSKDSEIQILKVTNEYWRKRDQALNDIVVERENRNADLTRSNEQLKVRLREVSHEEAPCLDVVVPDVVLDVLWDDTAKTASSVRGATSDIDSKDARASTTGEGHQ